MIKTHWWSYKNNYKQWLVRFLKKNWKNKPEVSVEQVKKKKGAKLHVKWKRYDICLIVRWIK